MIKGNKKIKLTEGVTLHFLPSDKFKMVLTGIYIKRPLLPVEASYNALLSRVLDMAIRRFPSVTALRNEMDYQYGTVIVTDVHKYGEKQTIQIKMSHPNEKYLNESKFFEKPLALMFDLLFDPLLVGDGFDPEIFNHAKERLKSEILELKDDKGNWAISRCIETMAADENYRIHEYGELEWLEEITPQSLYEHLQFLIREAEIDIIVNGDVSEDRAISTIKQLFSVERKSYKRVERENIYKEIGEVTYLEERVPVKQGRLVIGYRMNIPYESKQYMAAFLASTILGGGGGSKLFIRVREQASLCYSVFSRTDKFKSIMLIYAGIDVENYDKALKLILEEIEKMQQGNLTEQDLELAKEMIVSGYMSISDYQNSYINYYYGQYLFGRDFFAEDYINEVKSVTIEDVIEASKMFVLDTKVFINKEV